MLCLTFRMQTMFETGQPVRKPRISMRLWFLCAAVLLGPSLLVWAVRGVALAFSCAPGTLLCHGISLGGGLRETLNVAWFVGDNTFVALMIGFAASIAALFARRPLLAGLSVLLLPLGALVLPKYAVAASTYKGCPVNDAGVGDCLLWGSHMGMSFHRAAFVPGLLYDIFPYSFALAIMVGVIGFIFCRRRAA
jgi:hypothetical protein